MRIIVHIDMDAFFAACEERYNPQFSGKPIVVGADPKQGRGRGVVSTASYAARKFGIRSAMPISQAWRSAEEARRKGETETIFLRANFELYREVSGRIMAIIQKSADAFEEASIDEAYLEWKSEIPARLRLGEVQAGGRNSKSENDLWRNVEERAVALKKEILQKAGLTCSIGIGPNKLIAKIASDFKKPDGLTVVRSEEVQDFLEPLPIRVIPGIGPKTEILLHQKGIRTVGGLRGIALTELVEAFGKWGEDLYQKARGVDSSPVSNEWEPKSIGQQETFERDTLQAAYVLEKAGELAADVYRRFRQEGFHSFRTVVVTVRFADFITLTRSRTTTKPMTTLEVLNGEVLRLILPFLDQRQNPRRKKMRLIGLRVEKLNR